MRAIKTVFFSLALVCGLAQAASLEALQKKGEIVIGVKDSSPPFSVMDPKTRVLKGYDIEFAQGVAKRLNLRPVFRQLESDDRIPWLKEGKVDLVVADLTRTAERDKEIDFSVGYFVSDTRVLAKKGRFVNENALDGAKVAVNAQSSTSKNFRKNHPAIKLAEFEDKPEMVNALLSGTVDAVVTDGPILSVFLAKMPAAQRAQYEVSEFALETKIMGMGIPDGEKSLQAAVNNALFEMEQSGEAKAIFERWFGAQSASPMMRIFKINKSRD